MPGAGTQVARQWVLVLTNGTIVIDWGDDVFQDTVTGNFIKVSEGEISHTIRNEELDWLMRSGRVLSFDDGIVSFPVLPDRPHRLLG